MRRKKGQKRGRPAYRPSKKDRERVAIAAGGGMAHEEIALALGLSRNTLEKHFALELSVGSAAKRFEARQALFGAAKKGRVAAIKAYLAEPAAIAAPPLPKGDEKPAKPLGIKDQRNADATTAAVGTDWQEDLKPARTH